MANASHHHDNDAAIQLVCFDLGRVLVRLCDGWQDACREANVTPGVAFDETRAKAVFKTVEANEVGAITTDQFAERTAQMMQTSAADILRMFDHWLRGPFPGVVELLDQVNAAPVRTACLSNTNERHWDTVNDAGSAHHVPLHTLDHLFASHLIGQRKPDGAIYEHVERAVGVPGGAILFFDDTEANVDAALRRGWHAVRIDPAEAPVQQMRRHLRHHRVL